MRLIRLTILLLPLVCCNEPKPRPAVIQEELAQPVTQPARDIPTSEKEPPPPPVFDEIQYPQPVPATAPVPPVPMPPPTTNSCFDPNLKVADAMVLINSGVENTQWFIVENKEVSYQKNSFAPTDSILIKNELLQSGWVLTDSVYTSIGNENKILLTMQKDNRVCNIRKLLYTGEGQANNSMQEWFEVRKTN